MAASVGVWTAGVAAQALGSCDRDGADRLLADPGFLVHVDPDLLRSAVSPVYRPKDEQAQQALGVYRSVAHPERFLLSGLEPGGRAQVLAVQAARFGLSELSRRFAAADLGAWRCVWASGGTAPEGLLGGLPHPSWAHSVATAEVGGRTVAVTGGWEDAALHLWDLATSTEIRQPLTGHVAAQEGGVSDIAVVEWEGTGLVVSLGCDNSVRCWDVTRWEPVGEPLDRQELGVGAMAVNLVDGLPVLITGEYDGAVRLWRNPGRWEPWGEPLCGHGGGIWALAVGEVDGRPVAVTGGSDGAVRVWDLTTRSASGGPLRGHVGAVHSLVVAVVDDRPILLSGGEDSIVRMWDMRTREQIGQLLPDGKGAVVGLTVVSVPMGLTVFARRLGSPVTRFDCPLSPDMAEPTLGRPTPICGSQMALTEMDGRLIAVSAGEPCGAVRLWEVDTEPLGCPLSGHRADVTAVSTTRLGSRPVVLSGCEDGVVWVRDLATGTPLGDPMTSKHPVEGLAGTELGSRNLAVSCGGEDVEVWDVASRHLLTVLSTDCTWTTGIAVAETGGRIVAISTGGYTTQLWDVATAQELPTPFADDRSYFKAVAVTRLQDRTVVLTVSSVGHVTVWDLDAGESFSLIGHEWDVYYAAAANLADTSLALTGARAGTAGEMRWWNLETRSCLGVVRRNVALLALALAEIDGRAVALTSWHDSTVRAWDCTTGTELDTLHLPEPATALAWAEDRLIVGFGSEIGVFVTTPHFASQS
ncbi:WD40 repeat domain-containing protein [Streptomyces sp. NPDC056661]|uniref:WD40 repeat domain-containing protein n=1 Tax=Streptomyces sp. NPDC056661 TaxID=3345898 RepID=UPI0036C11350